jgi:hypothetical protein
MHDATPLGYPAAWQSWGLLDDEFLAEQLARYEAGEDRHIEHYRYAAFKRLLERMEWPDSLIDQYVELTRLDPDPVMACSALILLLEHRGLSDEQLARLEPLVSGHATLERRYQRALARRGRR